MSIFNYIFYILFFLAFVSPTNRSYLIDLGVLNLSIVEILLSIIVVINLFCTERNTIISANKKKYIYLIFLSVLINEFIFKNIFYNSSELEAFQSIRIGLLLFIGIYIILKGIRVNLDKVWFLMLLAINISVLISLINIFIALPIYSANLDENLIYMRSAEYSGRIFNDNSNFGLIGMYLLTTKNKYSFNVTKFQKISLIISVIAMIIAFNRTTIFFSIVILMYNSFSVFSIIRYIKMFFYLLILFVVTVILYNSFEFIENQMNERIINVFFGDSNLYENTIKNNRDGIFKNSLKRIMEGYFIFGLPYNTEIFYNLDNKISYTDTTILNILLRYGLIPFVLIIRLLNSFFIRKYFNKDLIFFIIVVFICSLNIDLIMRQTFFIMLIVFYSLVINEKKIYGL